MIRLSGPRTIPSRGTAGRRRIVLLAALAAMAPRAIAQRAPPRYTVAWLSSTTAATDNGFIASIKQALRELGGPGERDVVFDVAYSDARPESLGKLAAELVARKPDVIVAGATPGTRAVQAATKTIPVVMMGVSDPVGSGFAASLARPGGNITGIANLGIDSAGKAIELFREIVPGARRIAVLASANPAAQQVAREMVNAAAGQGHRIVVLTAETAEELEGAFAKARSGRLEGLVVVADAQLITWRDAIGRLAAASSLPTVSTYSAMVRAGGLASVGPDPRNLHKAVARYIDAILRGARPADMPIEQAAEFELVVNMRTAQGLGVTIPKAVLMRANEVIR